jgi:hypothetical protein
MVNLPPPIWTLAYLLLAAGIGYLTAWSRVPGLPLVPLGVLLIAIGIGVAFWAD